MKLIQNTAALILASNLRRLTLLSAGVLCGFLVIEQSLLADDPKPPPSPTETPQFQCASTVSYFVQRSGTTTSTEVMFAIVEVKGPTEDSAKQALTRSLFDQEQNARKRCSEQHESVASCITGQLVYRSSLLTTLDFAARRLVEDGIKKECETKSGVCGETKSTPPHCVAPPAPAADAAPEKGKDKKKK